MKKYILVVIMLIGISPIVMATFCGDGACNGDENTNILCSDYPFGLERQTGEFCSIAGFCPLDCGVSYTEGNTYGPSEPYDLQSICGDGICTTGIEDQLICKSKPEDCLISPATWCCQQACTQDCGSIITNSGLMPTGPTPIPLKLKKTDWIIPTYLNIGECTGKNPGPNGEYLGLGLCLEAVDEQGVTVSFRVPKYKDKPIDADNVESTVVQIKYGTLYNYQASISQGIDKYLFPIYNSIIMIDKPKNVIRLIGKKLLLMLKGRDFNID